MIVRTGLLRTYEDVLGAFQRIADVVWIFLAHWISCWAYDQPWGPSLANASVLGGLVFSGAAEVNGLYRPWRSERLLSVLRAVGLSWLVVPVALSLAAFATKTSADYSRVVSFGWFVTAPLLLGGWRIAVRLGLRHMRASGRNVRRVAVAGATASAEAFCRQVAELPWLGMQVVGIYDDRAAARRHQSADPLFRYAGTSADLVEACRQGTVDLVYIALPLRAEARIGQMLRALADTTATVFLLADFFTYDLLCARWSFLGNVPLVSIYDTPFRGVGGWVKRLEDVVFGSIILAIIAIPLLLIALGVKLTSPGPVLFRQRRYGLNGKEIRVLKFRTMTVCEDGAQIAQARRDDPRVTPFGRFLRRTSLDELPQFLQVLTGEMSIVGPRPHAVAHNEQYRALIHGYMLRHKVKPGITGWAQVNGWRGETPDLGRMQRRVEHDLEYIQNWSLSWDVQIILLTMLGRKKGQNAY
jgi:putative colanic acid biosysnthesis UDP-glucose lipid carrier transferase